eukprot:2731217-Prorocentrum_lima.AAC.1
MEPSCLAADPEKPSGTLQWGLPGEVLEGESEESTSHDTDLSVELRRLQRGFPGGVEDSPKY